MSPLLIFAIAVFSVIGIREGAKLAAKNWLSKEEKRKALDKLIKSD